MLEGVAASSGIAIGKAFLFLREDLDVPDYTVDASAVDEEIVKFESAIEQTKKELEEIGEKIKNETSNVHAGIFSAHAVLLDDPMFAGEVRNEIKNSQNNAAFAVRNVARNLIKQFSMIENEYIRGREADIRDVAIRLVQNILGKEKMDLSLLKKEVIVIAHDLSPSDTALMNKAMVIGFATDVGSRTSHTAIMARALEIPAVVGLGKITSQIKTDDLIIIDANRGRVLINPDGEVYEEYLIEQSRFKEFEQSLSVLRDQPSATLDGTNIELACNLEVPEELIAIHKYGAKGIGLYRTEYIFIRKQTELPSEEEQYQSYKEAVEKVAPDPVIIRTLDLGGDKFASTLGLPSDVSSMMGLRAIRLCLRYPFIFIPQLRAILRASIHGNLKVMFPMISRIEELRQAKLILEQAKAELDHDGIPYDPNLQVGTMIEIPSAALTADILAKESDFFSIGTNDLIQYTLAVHRVNEEIASLYEPLNPAILRLIKHVIDVAHNAGIWVGMCGEMANDPLVVPLLIGMEIDELSMSPIAIPEVKKIIRSLTVEEARKIANKALSYTTAHEIESYVYGEAMERFPDVLMWVDHRNHRPA
ncbi:MAG: phosphoenolpyruvate-protein phosphotransferase system enzyme [Candidatus Poribacteria bacterium]|nr:phosphoenolpyruvate-protein phosphotransferase system enzyme [Candidatus Poribacteria bacterium]